MLQTIVIMLAGAALSSSSAAVCAEDAPCFRWSTMGNHQRGIVTKSQGRVVVHPRGFCAALRAGDINWRMTRHLKGDPRCGR